MRSRKPTASSGPACHRCTALLQPGISRCSMCGWPAGVGFPPADGELENAAAVVEVVDEETAADEPDHVGVQVDALAGMLARQSNAVPAPDEQDSEVEAEPAEMADSDEADAAETADVEEANDDVAPTQSQDDAAADADDVDPLTAPIDALEGRTTTERVDVVDEDDTPVFADLVTETPAPQDAVEEVGDTVASDDAGDLEADVSPAPRAPKSAASIVRPAQLLMVSTAAMTLVLAGISGVFGNPLTGSMATVSLALSLVTLALWTGAAVTFLHWVARAHAHVTATSAVHQRTGPSLALLGWFIPVANYVIGYRVLQDLWTGSDPQTRDDASAAPAKVRMVDVWVLGLVTAALFGYVMPLALGDSALWAAVSAAGLMAAALGLASVMGTVSSWQSDVAAPAVEEAAAEEDHDPSEVTADSPVAVVADDAEAPTPEPVSVSASVD